MQTTIHQYKRGQIVRTLAFVGPHFDRDWSEKATIVRPDADTDWYIVRFNDGGSLCVHAERLMPCN